MATTSRIPAFEVERWMDEYETTPGVLNIAETCAASISIDKLVTLNRQRTLASPPINYSRPMTYGSILGSPELRGSIAALYPDGAASADNVIVTQGAIAANHLLFYSLINPGDHVVCVYPTYQQLYTVPATLGADVSLWRLDAEHGYVPQVSGLESLIKSNTRMIVINNPNNPTGVPIPRPVLEAIVDVARRHDLILFCDEVYSPLYHSTSTPPPSGLALGYDKVVVTGSMSKAWALAGIRVGWLATRSAEIRAAAASARDYTTISVSSLGDQVAAYALSDDVRPALLARNIALAQTNLALLTQFMERHPKACQWTKPQAGTTGFIKFSRRKKDTEEEWEEVEDESLAVDVLQKTGVMMVPGRRCFGNGEDFRGYMRIGYVSETAVLEKALERLDKYVVENLE